MRNLKSTWKCKIHILSIHCIFKIYKNFRTRMDQEGSNEASANLNDSVNTFDTNVSVKLEMPEQEIDDTIEYNDWDNENPE